MLCTSAAKTSTALLTTPKPLTVWNTRNCGKFLKRWEYQTTLPASWEIWILVKKQQWEWDMDQWTGSKLGKENIKAVYCHPAYLIYMHIMHISQAGWSTSWNQDSWGERTRDCSPGHAGKEGHHLAMKGASRGFSRAAAPVWIYLWAFYFVPLIYISVFVPVPYCLDNCGFVAEPEIR